MSESRPLPLLPGLVSAFSVPSPGSGLWSGRIVKAGAARILAASTWQPTPKSGVSSR